MTLFQYEFPSYIFVDEYNYEFSATKNLVTFLRFFIAMLSVNLRENFGHIKPLIFRRRKGFQLIILGLVYEFLIALFLFCERIFIF